MVYGRYNELDNYGIHGVYKPTNITGGPHPVVCIPFTWGMGQSLVTVFPATVDFLEGSLLEMDGNGAQVGISHTLGDFQKLLKIKYAPLKAPQVVCLCGRSDLYAEEGTIPKWFQFRFLIFSRLLRLCLICFSQFCWSVLVLSIFPGWWFQTLFLFHVIYGFSSFPLTNSIIFEAGYCTTNQIVIH